MNQKPKPKPRPIETIGAPHNAAGLSALHPAWQSLIRRCRDMGFGEIAQLKIQDGLPVMAAQITTKVKFI